MKNALKIFAVLIALLICLCSCGTETVTSEISFDDDTGSYEDFDAPSEAQKTSSKKKKASNKKKTSSTTETSKKEVSSSAKTVTSGKKASSSQNEETDDKFNYADYYTFGKSGSNKVIVYDAIDGYKNCGEYTVEVNAGDKWIDVPVYYAEVTRKNMDVMRTYFASVDLTGSIKVKITPSKKFSKCEIKPKVDVPSAKTSGGVVEFTVNKPMQLSLEFDGNVMNNLQFFANPIETNVPDPDDPDVIFLTPGIHDISNCKYIKKADTGVDTLTLTSGKTLYLAGGAVLKATLNVTNAKNVTIRGRGIVDLLYYNVSSGLRDDTLNEHNITSYPSGVRLVNTNNVKIEGVTFRNPAYYTVYGGKANETTIDNVKLFSRCQYSDGFDFMASSNVTVKNCYIRSNDDGIAIYATRWEFAGNAAHWNIDNCVFLTDCAHSVNIGTHGAKDKRRDEIFDIKFKDMDILDCYEASSHYWGALGFTVGDNNYVHDITFENIRMYKLASSRPVAMYIRKFSSGDTLGYRIENVLFKDITLYGQATAYNKSQLKGGSSSQIITGITFQNFVVGDTKVTSANKSAYFDIQSYVENVIFK